jgi:hypothetical protein
LKILKQHSLDRPFKSLALKKLPPVHRHLPLKCLFLKKKMLKIVPLPMKRRPIRNRQTLIALALILK